MKYKLFDTGSDKEVDVVLSAKNDLVDSELPNDEKIRAYKACLKDSDTRYCFIRGNSFYHSSDSGVHLASQIEEIAQRNDLMNTDVCFQAHDKVYIATLNRDRIVTDEDITSNLSDPRIARAVAIGVADDIKPAAVVPTERVHLTGMIVTGHTLTKLTKSLSINNIVDARARAINLAKILAFGLVAIGAYKYYQHLQLEKERLAQMERDRKQAEAFGHKNLCGFAAEAKTLIPSLLSAYSRYGIDNLTVSQRKVSLVGADTTYRVKELLARIEDKSTIEFPARDFEKISWIINAAELSYPNAEPEPLRNFAAMKRELTNRSIEDRYYLSYGTSNSDEWGVVRGTVDIAGPYLSGTLDTICERLGDYPFSINKFSITLNKGDAVGSSMSYTASLSTIGKL